MEDAADCAVIDQAKTRQADMLLMVVAPVQQLVEASAGRRTTSEFAEWNLASSVVLAFTI